MANGPASPGRSRLTACMPGAARPSLRPVGVPATVSDELKAEVNALADQIIAGEIVVDSTR